MAPLPAQWGSKLPLWDHQVAALRILRRFIEADGLPSDRSALVRMPTGTGKSGVIAIASRAALGPRDVLLLSPWRALVRQLGEDVQGRFWRNIGSQPPPAIPVHQLTPSRAQSLMDKSSEPTIWTATIATLQRLHDLDADIYRHLASRLGLVIVDEGHYEPARSWSRAVRELERPTVLFTATPYRNDYKFFKIDRALTNATGVQVENVAVYSHEQAELNHHLRPVKFKSIEYSDPSTFVAALRSVVKAKLTMKDRVIVRCASRNSVQAVAAALASAGEDVVAIHERFDSGPGHSTHRRVVPDPSIERARYWVHQYKLTEGIDDQSFRLVAFYEPFGTDRPFVQQVGRVLRNPTAQPPKSAWIVQHRRDGLDEKWEAYRTYDRTASAKGVPNGPLEYASSQPSSQYIEGRFRTPFDLGGANVHLRLRLPQVATVFVTGLQFDLNDMVEGVSAAIEDMDGQAGEVERPDASTVVHPYVAIQNSRFLEKDAFIEYSVGFTIYSQIGRYLFFCDTHSVSPPESADLATPSRNELLRLYPRGSSYLTSVALTNTDLGPSSVRRRSFSARNVSEVAPDLSDHSQLATSSRGVTVLRGGTDDDVRVQRYVGLGTGRIRDAGWTDFAGYKAWVQSLAASLAGKRSQPLAVFGRYAQSVAVPANTSPANILLDFDSELFEVPALGASPAPLDVDDLCLDVANGEFDWAVNGSEFRVKIGWNSEGSRYELRCAELDEFVQMRSELGVRNALPLVAYLNREQAFRVVPRSTGTSYSVYVGGQFSRPRLPIGPSANTKGMDLTKLLTPIPELATITSEKGAAGSATPTGWASDSLFHLVDTLGAGSQLADHLKAVDLLVCDDMGTEIADWIAVGPGLVAAVHAKASAKPARLSASALHEVAAQAIKNLGSFQPMDAGPPKNLTRWDKNWNGGKIGVGPLRIRSGATNGAKAWERIRSELRDPNTRREVWILLGNGLSLSDLEAERIKTKPNAEIVQILYLLQGTWATVAAVGATLRVFCCP